MIVHKMFLFWSFFLLGQASLSTANSILDREIVVSPKVISENPIFRSKYRYDNNERNTSAAYDLWDQIGYTLFEWPGNITRMDSDFPLMKWGNRRSKYVQSPCESERGMELAVYSHKYLHLTWGSNRLTASYCHPLRVDREYLPVDERHRKDVEIIVVDFDFVFDALLVVTEKGYIIRVGDIELAHEKKPGSGPHKRFLSYTIAQGLTQSVNRIIAQKCCSKTVNSCPTGDTSIAYREASRSFKVFISNDGGHNFMELQVAVSKTSSILHTLIFYSNWKRMYILHGSSSMAYIDEFSTVNGTLCTSRREKQIQIPVNGFVQTAVLGMELSFLIWDNCSVWYVSSGTTKGLVMSRSVFYIHNSIRLSIGESNKSNKSISIPHIIRSTHCYLGKDSSLYIGEDGKIGLLDQNNVFLYGVDLKSQDFSLVALSTDMSLLLPEKKYTICPCFDRNNRPKLLYPPRYLRLPNKGLMDKNYKRRLAMRIVKKTLFPSDFMSPFFEEHLRNRLPTKHKNLAFSKCMTSSLSVDGSVTQKSQTIRVNLDVPSSITITFYAYSILAKQLHFEPLDLLSFVNIDLSLQSSVPVGGSRFWVKYEANITLKSNYFELFPDQNLFLMNFFTIKSLRCIHQPQFPIWIKIDQSYEPRRSKTASFRDEKKIEIRQPATSLSLEKPTMEKIHHCPLLQAEFDRQTSTVCSQSGL